MKDLIIPEFGMTTEEVTIGEWLKAVGDPIRRGEPIAELITDKATVEFEASDSGTLAEIIVQVGETVPVGTVVARLALDGEPVGSLPAEEEQLSNVSAPAAVVAAATVDAVPAAVIDDGSAPHGGDGIRATPVARRLARRHAIDLHGVHGSGPLGRIRRNDVQRVIEHSQCAPAVEVTPESPASPITPALPAAPVAPARSRARRIELSSSQLRLARHLTVAAAIPTFSVARDIDVTGALAAGRVDGAPSFTDLLLRAIALSLREHERLNATFDENALIISEEINVAFAIAAGHELFVPVLRGADRGPVSALGELRRSLTSRALAGALAPGDSVDGTFTVSNMGTLGVTDVAPTVIPPQVAILGVGAPTPALRPTADGFATRQLCLVRLTCDHRAVNGATAAGFLESLAARLARPFSILEDR
jgi:pyruvate dehydrogenase E2 component (dihydrolipoyllysine-residue acetyltransferase)